LPRFGEVISREGRRQAAFFLAYTLAPSKMNQLTSADTLMSTHTKLHQSHRHVPSHAAAAAAAILCLTSLYAQAQENVSLNGYGGFGLTPSAKPMHEGLSVYQHADALPGVQPNKGHNYLAVYGLTKELETSFRLATQDLRCNWYDWGCPPGTIRDISGSVKYSPNWPWLEHQGWRVALGATDIGGAATHFRSLYAVASVTWGKLDIDLGVSRRRVATAPLDGPFASVRTKMGNNLDVGVQWVDGATIASTQASWNLPYTSWQFQLGVHAATRGAMAMPRNWTTVSLSLPLDERAWQTANMDRLPSDLGVRLRPLNQQHIEAALELAGLHTVYVQRTGALVRVVADNQRFAMNDADALAAALVVLARLSEEKFDRVELIITRRGWPIVKAEASPQCLARALSSGERCQDLVYSNLAGRTLDEADREVLGGLHRMTAWTWRPELTITPIINSRIGTEVNTWDSDLAVGINLVMPLMQGVTLDLNRFESLHSLTREFKDDGQFAGQRLKSGTGRAMLHGVWQWPARNFGRLSLGKAYTEYKGVGFESLTILGQEGRHRLNLSFGQFKRGPRYILGLPLIDDPDRTRSYQLANYRWSWGAREHLTTEVTAGTFWNQDKGYAISQRFWHGDAHIAVSFRRSRMPEAERPVAFAGLSLAVPLTPRLDVGGSRASIRGPAAWSYTVESKVMEGDNIITPGYGEIPRFGEHLSQFLNRDRFHEAYWRHQWWRVREAAASQTNQAAD
jgi:hypothetical protein